MKIYRKGRFAFGLVCILLFTASLILGSPEMDLFSLGMAVCTDLSFLLFLVPSFSPGKPEQLDERGQLIQLRADALTFSILQTSTALAGIALVLPYVFRETWPQAGLVGIVLMLVAMGTGVLQMGARLYYEKRM